MIQSFKAGALSLALFAGVAHADEQMAVPSFEYRYGVGAGDGGRTSGDDVLRVVRREHTGRAVGLQVLTGLLAGGVGGVGFKKSQLHGEKMDEIPNPGQQRLQDALRERVDAWVAANPRLVPTEALTVGLTAGDWVLLYQDLDKDDTPYELRYRISISLNSPSRGFLKGAKRYGALDCEPEPVVQPYEAWVDGEFAGVKQVQEQYVAQCAERFAELLPQWMQSVPMLALAEPAEPAEPVPVESDAPLAGDDAPTPDAQVPLAVQEMPSSSDGVPAGEAQPEQPAERVEDAAAQPEANGGALP